MPRPKKEKKVGTGMYQYQTQTGTYIRAVVKLSFKGYSWNEERRGFKNKTDVTRWKKERRAEVLLGQNLPERAISTNVKFNSLGHYTREYLDLKKNLKTIRTIKMYLAEAESFFGSDLEIEKIDKTQIKRYARHLDNKVITHTRNTGKKLTESSKLRYMCYLKAVLEMACDELDLKVPKVPVYSSKRTTEGADTPTPEEFAALIPVLDPMRQVLIYLITLTGMRRGDVMMTRWSDIVWVEGQPLLRFRSSKTQVNQLSAVIPDTLMDLLESLPKIGPFVFHNSTTGSHYVTFWHYLKNACGRAGIRHLTYHSWRKYATKLAVEAVGDVNLVAMYMGWSNNQLIKDVYCPRDVSAVKIATNVEKHWLSIAA